MITGFVGLSIAPWQQKMNFPGCLPNVGHFVTFHHWSLWGAQGPAVPIYMPVWRINNSFSSCTNCAFLFRTWLHVKTFVRVPGGRKCTTYCLFNNGLLCSVALNCDFGAGKQTTFLFLTNPANYPVGSLDHHHLHVVLVLCSICEPIYIYIYMYVHLSVY